MLLINNVYKYPMNTIIKSPDFCYAASLISAVSPCNTESIVNGQ